MAFSALPVKLWKPFELYAACVMNCERLYNRLPTCSAISCFALLNPASSAALFLLSLSVLGIVPIYVRSEISCVDLCDRTFKVSYIVINLHHIASPRFYARWYR